MLEHLLSTYCVHWALCFKLGSQKLVVALKRSLGHLGRCTKTDHYHALGNWGLGVATEVREGSSEVASLQV